MKIINKIQHELFGELFCFAEEDDYPLFWGIKQRMRFLSKDEIDLIIGLNIYCFNSRFKVDEDIYSRERVQEIINDIYYEYQKFLEDSTQIDEIFIKNFNLNKDEWDINAIIKTKDDLYEKIKVVKVDILKDSYIINFELKGEEEGWSLIQNRYNDIEEVFCINPTDEVSFSEMDTH